MTPIVAFCAYTGIINTVTALCLGIFILIKSYQIKTNRFFAYFCFSISIWSLFYYLWLSTTHNIVMAEFYLRTLMLPVLVMPATLFDFITSFLKINIPSWIRTFNYLFATCMALFVYTPLFAYDMHPIMNGFLWLKAGPLYHLFLFHFWLLISYGMWQLWTSYKNIQEKSLKKQTLLIFSGLLITFSGGAANYLPWYGFNVPPVTNITVPGYVILITYAILKYQLLDIKIVIKNSLIFSVLASMITILYFGVVYFSENILKITIGYHSPIASLATAVLVAIFFIPAKDFVQSLVEKYIFKATYAQIAEQNERLRRQIMVSERYKTFSEISKSVTVAIRDPLTTLKTYSHFYQSKLDDRAFLEKFGTVLSKEIQKIQDLTDGLSKYSTPEPLSIERTEIYFLINQVLEGLKHQLSNQKINLQHYYDDKASFWLHVDPKQLQQVLTNIILNSFKTMPTGGQLWIGAEKNEETFSIFIKDTGTPIPKDQLDKVFDPFHRYHEENQGLDLAIAFSIIENHGGKILVESGKDSGNEFIIQLPIN